jgi:hypothetical protein
VPVEDAAASSNDRYERLFSTTVTANGQFVVAASGQIAMAANSSDQGGESASRGDDHRDPSLGVGLVFGVGRVGTTRNPTGACARRD